MFLGAKDMISSSFGSLIILRLASIRGSIPTNSHHNMHYICTDNAKKVTMLQQERPLSCEVFEDMDLKMISTRK